MPGLRAARLQTSMRAEEFTVSLDEKLDEILVRLCEVVIQGQRQDRNLGVVAAAVLDPNDNCVTGINYPGRDGQRVHAERAAIENYTDRFGSVPPNSIVITTLSPCNEPMAERAGESCQDLLDQHGIDTVYCGYVDPTQQPHQVDLTANKKIQQLCKAFADTFLKDKLDELSFLGSPCTKDCSGHRAGYEWSKARGGVDANSPFSPSFNNGAALAKAGK
jgi:pyrimidine deaminase RibD-like protein